MKRLGFSSAAASLLRLLLQRAGKDQHRILLSDWCSTDWQSLTFEGERHKATFVVSGHQAEELASQWTRGLEDADLNLPHGFVGDLGLVADPHKREDGCVVIRLEALTLAD